MRRVVLMVLTLVVSFGVVKSQSLNDDAFDHHTRRGIEYVYNLEFENADAEFKELVRLKPKHPAGHFFLAMTLWWRILIDIENEQYDDRFYDSLDKVIDLCDDILDRDENDLTALFFKGGSIGFKGRLNAHRSNWFAAANAGRKALPIVQTASELDPNNYDILLGSGIYNYYAEVVPKEYPFVRPLMLFVPPGDKKKGIEQLKMAAEKGKYASIEATYFLMQLYYLHEKDYAHALLLASALHARFPNNILFHKYLGRCYVSLSNWAMVEEVWGEIRERCKMNQRGYNASAEREAEYYLGQTAMNKKEYQSALEHFHRSDELSRMIDRNEPSGFMVMTNLKVGMLYDLLSKRELAINQYKKVLAMKEFKDSYRQAEQFIKVPFSQ
jgi:tetratricopeptide (TPR) repeat protein